MNDFFTNLSDISNRLVALVSSYNIIIDTVDILLVAFVIYKLIKFMRASRSLYVVKGIILILLAYFVVNLVNMQASAFVFKLIMNNSIIVLLVLFAPELRHALESVGSSRFSMMRIIGIKKGDESQAQMKKSVQEICKACIDMSKKRIGALIVIEKDIKLSDIVTTGTVVDAKVSKELIGSLFFPNSPLHDGACIIRKGRVDAAGCILPLTKSTSVSSELGTRHRASLGLSEQCDAVILVVSEETGYISIAFKGELERAIPYDELVDKLTVYLNKKNESFNILSDGGKSKNESEKKEKE